MKRFSRVLATAVLFVGAASSALAATPANVLNKLELQRFVDGETPVADLSLAAHFNGLAEQFFNEADHYSDVAVVYRANANRSASTTAADNAIRLAAHARAWGVRARQLARFYIDRAAGRWAILPMGAPMLQGGYGAPEPSKDRLHKLALTARTRTDHLTLHEYYSTVARKRTAEANNYLAMATGYRAGVHHGSYDAGFGYDRLEQLARKAARDATLAAERHQVFANIG